MARRTASTAAASTSAEQQPRKKAPPLSTVWREAREIIWERRRRLSLGLLLMIISRLAGLVLPASSKFLIDKVLVGKRVDLLLPIALATAAATLVQAATSFGLSQLLGV
ncbi:MAG TPA: ABC transporter ATP-binding protein, partial [Thermoanaerobaculia bacterium]|nr:ABC transporter ATP-binding protein [Thermoanaerobaculia bacterium]